MLIKTTTSIMVLCLLSLHLNAVSKTYIIGVEDQLYYPHYHYENGEFSGYARELLDSYAQHEGHTFIYKALAINELFQHLVTKKIDFKYPDNPYWQHKVKEGVRIAYSNPVTPYIDGVTMKPSNALLPLSQLKKLGTLTGFTPLNYEYLIQAGDVELIEMPSTLKLIIAIGNGTIDGIYGNVDVITYQAKIRNGTLVFNKTLPYTAQSYMLSTAKEPRELKAFNQFLSDNQPLINNLKKKYGIKDIGDER